MRWQVGSQQSAVGKVCLACSRACGVGHVWASCGCDVLGARPGMSANSKVHLLESPCRGGADESERRLGMLQCCTLAEREVF
eukprot:10392428-Alexandrium_andersonii.AAC.1